MLTLPSVCHDAVVAHCQGRYPKEACGYLAGEGERVTQVYPMTNTEDSPIGYTMDPKEQLQVEKQMRQRRQRLLGIYHSHTATDAYPSPVDVSLAISPQVSYVLVSLKDRPRPVMRSFRIDGSTIQEEPLAITETFHVAECLRRGGLGIMEAGAAATIDVRDMLCAQALALVAQAVGRLGCGQAVEVRCNAEDVRRDLSAWAADQGHGLIQVDREVVRIEKDR